MKKMKNNEDVISFFEKLLARNAEDPTAFQSGVRAFGKKNPKGFHDFCAAVKAAGVEIASSAPSTCLTQSNVFRVSMPGELVRGKDVYVGDWSVAPTIVAPLYVAADFERDERGNQIELTFNEQKDEFAKRNGGRAYGNGCIEAIGEAIINGCYREGDVFHGPLEYINGNNIRGNKVREVSVLSLLKAETPALENILKDIRKGGPCFTFSGAEHPLNESRVHTVSFTGGEDGWESKNALLLGVLPFRVFGIRRFTL